MKAIHGTANVILPGLRATASATVTATFAYQHFKAAITFCDQVDSIESKNRLQPFGPFFEDLRSYGSACVMSGTAAIEALINEHFITPHGPLRQMFNDFERDFWGQRGVERMQPLKKYQTALKMLGLPRMDERTSPYRDAWALVELRNSLVHYKPTWDPARQRTVDMVEVLKGQYELSPFPGTNSDFVTMQSMSTGCAQWVIDTAVAFWKEFHTRALLDPPKMEQFFQIGTRERTILRNE